jgi:ornithine decarboxylase
MDPASYAEALDEASDVIREAGVPLDIMDVGGGFPSRYPGVEPPALTTYFDEIERAFDRLALDDCRLLCEPGRALVAESESVLVRVEARRGNRLYINDGAFGTLYDAAHCNIIFPARLVRPEGGAEEEIEPFGLYGPTCDTVDFLPGPFLLPGCVSEGDHIEIGQIGAYGRVFRSTFNGFGEYEEVILQDAPMLTMYAEPMADIEDVAAVALAR